MIAVIFEVRVQEGKDKQYLDIASDLFEQLKDIDGFISIERFQSLTNEGKILSLSFWRDEDSVRQWRSLDSHRFAQQKGRKEIFDDYRLRVAHVVRDYGMENRVNVPEDSLRFHRD